MITTQDEHVVSQPATGDISQLHPCTHEEADTRIMLHVAHAYQSGYQKCLIHATDTDIVVLSIATAKEIPGLELWVAFGHGNNFRFISSHGIAVLPKALLYMHAVTGCDTVSSFCGIGKKTGWAVLRSLPHIWEVFERLSQAPNEVSEQHMIELERFVVLLYKKHHH